LFRLKCCKNIAHFDGGEIEDHKGAQREWIRDIGPTVETNIGFIESYRDPEGIEYFINKFIII
jgi:dipeptidyl-peptidase-3